MDDYTWTPDVTRLDHFGALLMMGYLESVLDRRPATQRDWRKAYGAAADDQTVRAARTLLTQAVAS